MAKSASVETESGAAAYMPSRLRLSDLRRAAGGCQGCHLYRDATQTVFGEGPAAARIVMMGEQPGDHEDLSGRPFVGPAGRVLDRALAELGVARGDVYVTNAVKHFRFTERGKRRLHQRPGQVEITACRPWGLAELAVLRPQVLVCLGATAAQAVFGRSFRLTQHRGEPLDLPADVKQEVDAAGGQGGEVAQVVCTVHPSSVLRAPDREDAYEGLCRDLRAAV